MQWLSVCISIPAIWKSKLNEKNISWPTAQGNCTQLHPLTVKLVYKKHLKDVLGWQFLTMKAAETLRIVCFPPEKHISSKKYLGNRPSKKSHFIRV